MEKMNDKIANKIFNEIDNRWEETLKLTYGEDKIPVEAYCHIPVTAIEIVANLVAELSCENNNFDYIKCKMALARCIVEFFTNIPVPTLKQDDGEISDFTKCYEIVYGTQYGLVNNTAFKMFVVDVLEDCVFTIIENQISKNDPQSVLAQRALELGAVISATLKDFIENPATLTEFLEALGVSEQE